jgi:hypothetical protein
MGFATGRASPAVTTLDSGWAPFGALRMAGETLCNSVFYCVEMTKRLGANEQTIAILSFLLGRP